jgi:hypothetical protein
MNITEAIRSLRPNAEFSVLHDDPSHIVWIKCSNPPTVAQIVAERDRLLAIYNARVYQRQRAPEYPPIGDQLDALWKGGDAAAAMLAKIQAVKDKYPKPEGV